MALFYINPEHDTLNCTAWRDGQIRNGCPQILANAPGITVAPSSRRMIILADANHTGLLLTYENLSHRLNIVYIKGTHIWDSTNVDNPDNTTSILATDWYWHNKTDVYYSRVNENSGSVLNESIAQVCNVIGDSSRCSLFCLGSKARDKQGSVLTDVLRPMTFDLLIGNMANLTFGMYES